MPTPVIIIRVFQGTFLIASLSLAKPQIHKIIATKNEIKPISILKIVESEETKTIPIIVNKCFNSNFTLLATSDFLD